MNPFILPKIVAASANLNDAHFELQRSENLHSEFAKMFSTYLGCLQSGVRFESEILLVTGHSGTGKTKEVDNLLTLFNASEAALPTGQKARIVPCILDRKGGWKDLGKKTLRAMGYPIAGTSRKTQVEIWELVVVQAKLQGIVGIHYDEAQHIFAGRSEKEQEISLDSFKTLLKSHDWPLILILSGVPELSGYVHQLDQLLRKVTHVPFNDINLPEDYDVLNEIVCSFAMKSNMEIGDDLLTEEFLHRLVTAGAYRWGLVFEITNKASMTAAGEGARTLTMEHFNEVWVTKTRMHPIATPFTHEAFETMFRREKPFQTALEST
jgi:hypothetical protein